jgi:hypothetical protein
LLLLHLGNGIRELGYLAQQEVIGVLRDEQATTLFLALYLNIVGSIDRRCGYEHEGYQGD